MIRSMTGFGRGEIFKDNLRFFIEVKTVNHRYCDCTIKMPRKFTFIENRVKKHLKKYVVRGKVDIFITFESENEQDCFVNFNSILLENYLNNFSKISQEYNIKNDISMSNVINLPDVIKQETSQFDETLIWDILVEALDKAFMNLVEMRQREGQLLAQDLRLKLNNLEKIINEIKQRAPFVVQSYKKRLEDNVQKIIGNNEVDQSRMVTEIAIFADKCSIDEEVVRLESHTKHMSEILNSENVAGRKLDFLTQEMNRESNTIGSKANDMEISKLSIELKSEIEKIREQIQNIE